MLRRIVMCGAIVVALAGCIDPSEPVTPAEQFSRACTAAGEAMAQVIRLRREGRVGVEEFVSIDNAYDKVVVVCDTLPVGDTPTQVAVEKLSAFLLQAGDATGVAYGY